MGEEGDSGKGGCVGFVNVDTHYGWGKGKGCFALIEARDIRIRLYFGRESLDFLTQTPDM